jgi:hypothetical protein
MSLKNAAFVALVGMILLTVLSLAGFIRDVVSALNGLVPAIRVLTSLVYVVASITVTVFFYVFHKTQS